mmetsp:Transcript_15088/g.33189  ORF Transcript_15088/g.33189 Transcript_15088/m.33189 type:complete len:222 (-) Transcript_15088:175-840(-)
MAAAQTPGNLKYSGELDGAMIYPAPVFVRNTFTEVNSKPSPFFEGLMNEWQVYSCPTSGVSEASEAFSSPTQEEAFSAPCSGYMPGLALARSAQLGVETQRRTTDHQDSSDCSTADTAERVALTPPPEFARSVSIEENIIQEMAAAATGTALNVGSAGHHLGLCKPCAFVNTKGCASGMQCQFCHLCQPGTKKLRQKEKRLFFGTMKRLHGGLSVPAWRQQ